MNLPFAEMSESGNLVINSLTSQVPQGAYFTRVNKSGSRFDYTLVYASNISLSNYVGVVYQVNRASYWFAFPSEINQRNTIGVSTYARRVMEAPVEREQANQDDSYSLQDIVEYHPEIARSIMPVSGARFDQYDENELILDNATFQIEPQTSWSMQFEIQDGSTITVNAGENFTTTSTIRLIALQQIVDAEPVTYSDTMSSPDIPSQPFTYEGDYQYPEAVMVSGTVLIDNANDAEWSIQLLRTQDNIETDENEFGYYVRTTIIGDTKYASPQRSGIVQTQEEGEILFDDVVAGSQATIDNDLLNKQLEEAQQQTDEDSEETDLSGAIPGIIFGIVLFVVIAGAVSFVGGVE